MSQPALAGSAPAPFLRRGFDWWLAQVKHALPPTIFFFIGFNLILWTKRLILEEHGVEFSGFLAALLVGKAVLVTDNLPFMHRFDGAPMIQDEEQRDTKRSPSGLNGHPSSHRKGKNGAHAARNEGE